MDVDMPGRSSIIGGASGADGGGAAAGIMAIVAAGAEPLAAPDVHVHVMGAVSVYMDTLFKMKKRTRIATKIQHR
jgi:hypothetical protein